MYKLSYPAGRRLAEAHAEEARIEEEAKLFHEADMRNEVHETDMRNEVHETDELQSNRRHLENNEGGETVYMGSADLKTVLKNALLNSSNTNISSAAAELAHDWCVCWTAPLVAAVGELTGWNMSYNVTPVDWNAAKVYVQEFVIWHQENGGLRRLQDGSHTGRRLFENTNGRRRLWACPRRSSRACHPPHATVELASGATARLDALAVGDRIRTPSGVEPVVGFLHADKAAFMTYHVFTTEANLTIAISDKHYLFVDGVKADPATVVLGQTLTTANGPQKITAIAQEMHAGAFHLVTPSGAYYVDGVAASTYVSYIPHAAWKVFGDGYITLRYKLGLPIVPEGAAPVTLFWLLDALQALGVPEPVQSSLFWPLIAGSVVLTELAAAVGVAAAKLAPAGAVAAALVAAPLARASK